jgi:hypothetical protein
LRAAQEVDPDLVGIMMTGHGAIDTAVEAMKAGALDYILKPFKMSAILPVLSRALTVGRLRRENAILAERVRQRTRELEQANRELGAANKELEAFSYSVSHDLRAPLRHIDGFSNLLVENYGAQLPEDAQRLLQKVRDGARRLDQLINDLLNFSRLSRQALVKRSVSMTRLVEEVWEELEHDGRAIDFRLGPLPDCQGDPSLLKQVWVNLISNALKFTRKRDPAIIEVEARVKEGEVIYSVRDNGAGFDMAYASKLFGVFQRLHRADQFEGTGVGLSIVQRIVQRHGGRIWAEAEPEKGARFLFTLGLSNGAAESGSDGGAG